MKDIFLVYVDTAAYKQVQAFNSRPADFDWQAFLAKRLE